MSSSTTRCCLILGVRGRDVGLFQMSRNVAISLAVAKKKKRSRVQDKNKTSFSGAAAAQNERQSDSIPP